MIASVKSAVHAVGRAYIRRLCYDEYSSQVDIVKNERTIEYRFALECLRGVPTAILDVGTGTTAWPSLLRTCGYKVSAIDNVVDYWKSDMINRHWHVENLDIASTKGLPRRRFDAITCISVLEHIQDHVAAMKNMSAMLNPGGRLILTTPYSHCNPHPNVYKHPDALYGQSARYICRSSAAGEMEQWLATGITLEARELWRLFTGTLWATGQRCAWEQVQESEPHQLGCFLFTVPA